jgi:hypothetical protein
VGVTTRCLYFAELDSVMVSNFITLLNITEQASFISISRGEKGQ